MVSSSVKESAMHFLNFVIKFIILSPKNWQLVFLRATYQGKALLFTASCTLHQIYIRSACIASGHCRTNQILVGKANRTSNWYRLTKSKKDIIKRVDITLISYTPTLLYKVPLNSFVVAFTCKFSVMRVKWTEKWIDKTYAIKRF